MRPGRDSRRLPKEAKSLDNAMQDGSKALGHGTVGSIKRFK